MGLSGSEPWGPSPRLPDPLGSLHQAWLQRLSNKVKCVPSATVVNGKNAIYQNPPGLVLVCSFTSWSHGN